MTTTTKKPSAAEAHRNAQIHKIAVALKCKLSNVPARLKALDLVVVPCGRCGGSGCYSWNAMTGDRCFGCDGFKVKLPKVINDADVVAVVEAVAAGKLQPYLDDLRARREMADLSDRLLKLWGDTNIATLYGAVSLTGIREIGAGQLYQRNSDMLDLVLTAQARANTVRTGKPHHDYHGKAHAPVVGDTVEKALAFVRECEAKLPTLDLGWDVLSTWVSADMVAKAQARQAKGQ